MNRPGLTVTIITLNEEKSLPRAIESVKWADEVLVVDSGSTDKTVDIARQLGARVMQNPWPGYGKQKNFAQNQAKFDWVLNIDADEEVTPELSEEIQNAISHSANGVWGYAISRKTYYLSRWIRHGGWYPNFLVRLVHRAHARWTEPNVHESLEVAGNVQKLKHALNHYTFASIEDQIHTNLRYAKCGAQDLRSRGVPAQLLRLLFKPVGKFIETYFLKLGFLDGLPGFIISVNAAHSMFLKHAFLFEDRERK